MFHLKSDFSPKGDQQQAIDLLTKGINDNNKSQVLLGITGSGKTFTMANVIQNVNMPTLILAHNKTLAAQLYQEFKLFFPDNAIEYFVSYYDYYQPEAYIARTNTYIEKDLAINDTIDKMRLSATKALIERKDVIIISSISCIYGLGMPENYSKMILPLKVNTKVRRDNILMHLVEMHYKRNDNDLSRASFRVRGDVLEIAIADDDEIAYRVEFFGDEIERISEIHPLTGQVRQRLNNVSIFPGSHHVTPEEVRVKARVSIKKELEERIDFFDKENKLEEKQRIKERTNYDLEMIKEIGFCKGIENYSRHFSNRAPNAPPTCLLDYFPKSFLIFIDESHQSIPQIHAMYNGDRARKQSLVEFGFRLPSAFDNRPLKFEEVYKKLDNIIYVSATPSQWEIQQAPNNLAHQIIRPTGLLDPLIEIKKATNQVEDVLEEIRKESEKNSRTLVTTLTKHLSEELSKYLNEIGVKAKYIHSDVTTLERIKIIKDLRLGKFDVLVGINLLREGLDIPEVSLVAILDADKQGFLRSETALLQTCGRAARNEHGRVIMYADTITPAIKNTIEITTNRRVIQAEYNKKNNITPQTIKKAKIETLEETFGLVDNTNEASPKIIYTNIDNIDKQIKVLKKEMKKAAKELRFEDAAAYRDQIKKLENIELLS